ncbi:MAG: MerR family transcriptional regulator [Bacteroidales bacterium]|nr:MerR family transcriptional regulator [Bacteroidales bacterium]
MKLKIGEFSKMMQITIKTLRHYEQMDLLKPIEVDKWTGYRYYSVEQMQTLKTILELKSMGFSLEEIKELLQSKTHIPSYEQLESKISICQNEMKVLERRLLMLHNLKDSRKKIEEMEKLTKQKLPAIIVASHREVIKSYEELGPLCVNIIGPEMQRLGCKCSEPGCCFTIEHNKEYTPKDIDIEYCEQVEEMGEDSSIIKFKKLEEVPVALCIKHYGPYNRLYQSYCEAYKYIEENDYSIIGHPRFSYVDGVWNQDDEEKWLTIIQIPIQTK